MDQNIEEASKMKVQQGSSTEVIVTIDQYKDALATLRDIDKLAKSDPGLAQMIIDHHNLTE